MVSQQKVAILPLGCPENRIDSARISAFYRENGYVDTQNIRMADVVVINTCALTSLAEEKSIRVIEKTRKIMKKDAQLLICGCLANLKPELECFENALRLGVDDDLEKLNDYFFLNKRFEQCHANSLMPSYYSCDSDTNQSKAMNARLLRILKELKIGLCNVRVGLKKYGNAGVLYYLIVLNLLRRQRLSHHKSSHVYGPDVYSIKISTGCYHNCSFCSVRLSRGKLKSKPLSQVIEEFQEGVRLGFTKFGLLGTEIGIYGKDIKENLVGLIDRIMDAGTGHNFEIRLRNIHPQWVIDNLLDLERLLDTGVITYISTPLQSGSDRILELMKRGYNAEEMKHAAMTIKNNFPSVNLHSQVLVGFPGETDDDFCATLNFLKEVEFDGIEVYNFTPRDGTLAARMPNQVPFKTSLKRTYEICKAFDHALRMG